MTKKFTSKQILNLPMQENDGEAATIREYFRTMIREVWVEGEGFSGKRPFGNSGWENEVYSALVEAGAIKGEFDEDGYLEDCDSSTGHILIREALGVL